MKPHRILWQVLPNPGIFRWRLLRDGKFERLFLFQNRAIKAARESMAYEWDCYAFPAELMIHNRDGQIRAKDTYPRESDPPETKG